jgi:hypothetical protein
MVYGCIWFMLPKYAIVTKNVACLDIFGFGGRLEVVAKAQDTTPSLAAIAIGNPSFSKPQFV